MLHLEAVNTLILDKMRTETKIGFLFNHDAPHQVGHIAPIINHLIDIANIKVIAMATSEEQLDRLRDIVGNQDNVRFEIMKLEVPVYLRNIFRKLNMLAPIQRLYILKRYISMFQTLDCLVVSEMTSSILKTHFGITTPLVILPHGAGDRAIGYKKVISHYDYVLLSGTKVRDRMIEIGLIQAENHCIVGYPKFDLIKSRKQEKENYFNNMKPIVLYNPHFDPLLSSWYNMGLDVLDFFADNPDYNLIVAPHVMLFKKKLQVSLENGRIKFTKNIPSRYYKCPNIRIDLGSMSSVNMDYTLTADIYLGDVSSQVYEFLYKPRPCIFLNSHQADWMENPNYMYWHCGPVLNKVSDLAMTLENIKAIQETFHDSQVTRFQETFDLKEIPSSLRAANAIVSFLDFRATLPD
jgi:hypothetical protein